MTGPNPVVNLTLENKPGFVIEINRCSSGTGLGKIIEHNVPAGTTVVVDITPLSAFFSVEYLVNFRSTLPAKHETLKLVVHKTDIDLGTSVFAILGDNLNIAVDAFINGANAELRVSNNEAFNIVFRALKQTI